MAEQRTTPRVRNENERIDEKTLVNKLLYARLIPNIIEDYSYYF